MIDKEDAPLTVDVVGPKGPCQHHSIKLDLTNNVLAALAPLSDELRWYLAPEDSDLPCSRNEDDQVVVAVESGTREGVNVVYDVPPIFVYNSVI